MRNDSPNERKKFEDLKFLQNQLQSMKVDLEREKALVESPIAAPLNTKQASLKNLVLRLSDDDEFTSADKLNLSLGELLERESARVDEEAFTYKASNRDTVSFEMGDDDLATKAAKIKDKVKSYSDSLEKINTFDTDVIKARKVERNPIDRFYPATRMMIHSSDNEVSPLNLEVFKSK